MAVIRMRHSPEVSRTLGAPTITSGSISQKLAAIQGDGQMPLTHMRRIGLPLVAAIAAFVAVAAPAVATAGTPSGIGTYKTWAEAQRAAGFQLYKPTTSYKLPNVGHVIVSVCETAG